MTWRAPLGGLLTAALLGASAAAAAAPAAFPPFTLVNQSGATVRSQDLRGYALVVSFIYTRCTDTCPLITAQLAKAQAAVRKNPRLATRVRFLTITVDPAHDTPEALARYARGHGAGLETWDFLTGPRADVVAALRALNVGRQDRGNGRVGHTNVVLFVGPDGRVVARHTDLEIDADRVTAVMQRVLG